MVSSQNVQGLFQSVGHLTALFRESYDEICEHAARLFPRVRLGAKTDLPGNDGGPQVSAPPDCSPLLKSC